MNAYIFKADICCEACAADIRARRICEGVQDDGTSESIPQGPYADGGGEADTPQHCAHCGAFLENPLTSAGAEYVRAAIRERPRGGVAARVWAPFYGLKG